MAFLIDPNFKNIKMFVLVVFLAGFSHRKVKWSKIYKKESPFSKTSAASVVIVVLVLVIRVPYATVCGGCF